MIERVRDVTTGVSTCLAGAVGGALSSAGHGPALSMFREEVRLLRAELEAKR